VSIVVLLRMDLRMEFNKASQRAAQRAAKDLGKIASGSSDDEESDALPIDSAPLDAMKRVTESLSGLLPLLVADAPTARAFTQDILDAGRKPLADAMGDPETCGAIFRAPDYLFKRDPDDVVDKATKNAWRWFCETHYNDGRGGASRVGKKETELRKDTPRVQKARKNCFRPCLTKCSRTQKTPIVKIAYLVLCLPPLSRIMTSGFVSMSQI
jgi:hypothetical protein